MGLAGGAQVRIPDCSTRRPVEGFERRGESPGHTRDAGQKRRSRSEAGPVQHGNALAPARAPRSWWWAMRRRCRQEAHDRCDCAPAGTIRAMRCSDHRRTEVVRSHMDTLSCGRVRRARGSCVAGTPAGSRMSTAFGPVAVRPVRAGWRRSAPEHRAAARRVQRSRHRRRGWCRSCACPEGSCRPGEHARARIDNGRPSAWLWRSQQSG